MGPTVSTVIVDGNTVPDEAQPSIWSRRHVDGTVLFRRHVDGKGLKTSPGKASFVLVHLDDHADFGSIKWRHPWDPSKTPFTYAQCMYHLPISIDSGQ